jgi:hypothetical protein
VTFLTIVALALLEAAQPSQAVSSVPAPHALPERADVVQPQQAGGRPTAVTGRVVDSAGLPIAGAIITVKDSTEIAVSAWLRAPLHAHLHNLPPGKLSSKLCAVRVARALTARSLLDPGTSSPDPLLALSLASPPVKRAQAKLAAFARLAR